MIQSFTHRSMKNMLCLDNQINQSKMSRLQSYTHPTPEVIVLDDDIDIDDATQNPDIEHMGNFDDQIENIIITPDSETPAQSHCNVPVTVFECPICYVIPLPPLKIQSCTNGHSFCSTCITKLEKMTCPTCKIALEVLELNGKIKPTTVRNLFLESIISTYLNK